MEENDKAISAPMFADGAELRLGDRVKVPGGAIMRVAAVAFSEGRVLVSDKPLADGERGFVAVPRDLASPADDSLEEIEADSALAPKEYCDKRALLLEDGVSRQQAMTRDLLERQMAVLTKS